MNANPFVLTTCTRPTRPSSMPDPCALRRAGCSGGARLGQPGSAAREGFDSPAPTTSQKPLARISCLGGSVEALFGGENDTR